MRRTAGRLLGLALALAAAGLATAPASSANVVPEPAGLWTGPMRGDTPATLAGGTVLDLPALEALMAKKPLLLDFGPAPRKPDDFPKNGIWLPTHRSIPGAVWMPGAGAAPLDPAREALFYERVGALTAGDKAKPVVAFCHPQCWASWNAAKRLVLKGYRSVYWFPGGIESWQKAHETAAVKPDGGWSAGGAK